VAARRERGAGREKGRGRDPGRAPEAAPIGAQARGERAARDGAGVGGGEEMMGGRGGAGGAAVADHGFQHPQDAREAEQDQGVPGGLGALPRAGLGARAQLRRQGGEGVGQG
jgi:hypothetical protein